MTSTKNYFKFLTLDEKIVFISIILFPVLLTTGPLMPDLIVSLCGIIFIYKFFKDKEFYNFLILNYKKEIFLFSIFFIIIILSLLNSSFIKNSFFYQVFFILDFFIFISCFVYFL